MQSISWLYSVHYALASLSFRRILQLYENEEEEKIDTVHRCSKSINTKEKLFVCFLRVSIHRSLWFATWFSSEWTGATNKTIERIAFLTHIVNNFNRYSKLEIVNLSECVLTSEWLMRGHTIRHAHNSQRFVCIYTYYEHIKRCGLSSNRLTDFHFHFHINITFFLFQH